MKFKANIFIVPNLAFDASECSDLGKSFEKRLAIFDEFQGLGKMVQIWTVSPKEEEDRSDNWADHGTPEGVPIDMYQWPGYFPVSMMPKVEGETIVLHDTSGNEYHLTARQLDYRYRYFGTWEQVLAQVQK